jgi:hypothetical protein
LAGDVLMDKQKLFEKSFNIVVDALRDDSSYYYAWQSNIAMSFVNELERNGFRFPDMKEMANVAAKNFLNILIIRT